MIRCYTLFDITNTGVKLRNIPKIISEDDYRTLTDKLNCQCNFDTILQIISLRTQPEVIEYPKLSAWKNTNLKCWTFTFDVYHPHVYGDGFGALYEDCSMVPMIDNSAVGTVWLNSSNIFFEKNNELRL